MGTRSSNQPLFATIKEHKGNGAVPDYQNMVEDEYSNYDELFDGSADQQLINSGVTIISSTFERNLAIHPVIIGS